MRIQDDKSGNEPILPSSAQLMEEKLRGDFLRERQLDAAKENRIAELEAEVERLKAIADTPAVIRMQRDNEAWKLLPDVVRGLESDLAAAQRSVKALAWLDAKMETVESVTCEAGDYDGNGPPSKTIWWYTDTLSGYGGDSLLAAIEAAMAREEESK